MGAGGSKEVVVSNQEARGPPAPSTAPASPSAVGDARYREAEGILFREGFRQGVASALSKIDEEVERQTRAAFATAALDDESARQEALRAAIAQIEATHYRAPARPLQCQTEEAALSACASAGAASKECGTAVAAYTQCTDGLVAGAMQPLKPALR